MSGKQNTKPIPNGLKFLFGGLAGMMATCIVQPLDLVKNRMQTSGVHTTKKEYNSTFDVISGVLKKEGPLAFYNGLSAGLLRQATYSTGRLGCYQYLFEVFTKDGVPPSFAVKMFIGMVSGMVGAFIGTPAEVSLIRMTADGRLPPAERRNYKNVIDALVRIVREEGFTTLWRGAVATMGRAMVVNAAQLSTYSQMKQLLLSTKYFVDNVNCHLAASVMSGFITSVVSMPVDLAKTRIQNMKTINGKPQYTGTLDVFAKVVGNEGILALWKGFTPYFCRIAPHTVLTFIFLEQLNSLYRARSE